MSDSLQLLDLNDDVLCHIVNYLWGGRALCFSLASKRTYELAIHRVAARIRCRNQEKLLLVHRTLFRAPRPRVRYLEDLVIDHDVVDYKELLAKEGSASGDGGDATSITISLITDLILNAPNLRRLTLPHIVRFMKHDHRLESGLLGLRKLSRLEGQGVGVNALPFIQFLWASNWNLTVLSLDGAGPYDYTNCTKPWISFLNMIAALTHLHTLRIHGLQTPMVSFKHLSDYSPPILPSLRRLFFRAIPPASLDLAELMPNLHTFHFWLEPLYAAIFSDLLVPTVNPPLPPMRSIALYPAWARTLTNAILSTAHHLQFVCDVDGARETQAQAAEVAETFRNVAPVRAQLWTTISARNVEFLRRLCGLGQAQRLRSLELKVGFPLTPPTADEDVPWESWDATASRWFEDIPAVLGSLSLVGLRVQLGKMPRPPIRHLRGDPRVDEWKAAARRRYATRVKSAEALPRRLAVAIRSLRVLAIGDEEPDEDYDGTSYNMKLEIGEGAEDDREELWDDYEYESAWYADRVRTLQWWRVVWDRVHAEDRDVVRLEALTLDQGTRVQRFFENADGETVERVNDFLSEL